MSTTPDGTKYESRHAVAIRPCSCTICPDRLHEFVRVVFEGGDEWSLCAGCWTYWHHLNMDYAA